MTENKRFTYDAKQVAILKNGEFWLECAISTACNHSEICNELNNLVDENEQLKNHIQELQNHLKRLETQNIQTYNLIKEAYNNERTKLGQSVLKQLMEAIQ